MGWAGLRWAGPRREAGASAWAGVKANLLCPPAQTLHMVQILCIDEATASVDQKTDQLLQQTICKRFANKTVLTIAHRCASIRMRLQSGDIVSGTPGARALESPNSHEPQLLILIAHCLKASVVPSTEPG